MKLDREPMADHEPTEKTETTTAPETDTAVADRMKSTYERFVQTISDELANVRTVGMKQWEDALTNARELVRRGNPSFVRDEIESVARTVRKDARHALLQMKKKGEGLFHTETFLNARDKGTELLLKVVTRIKDAAEAAESNLEEASVYRKGEHVPGGAFLCAGCAHEVVLDVSRRIPSCPECGKEEFRRKG